MTKEEKKKGYTIDDDVNMLSRTKELLYHQLQNEVNSEKIGQTYHDLGQIYQRIKNYPLAHQAWNKALEYFNEVQEPLALASTYYQQGLLFLEEKQMVAALEKWHQVLTVLRSAGGGGGLLRCQTLYQIGKCNCELKNLQEAKEYLSEGIVTAKRGGYFYEEALAMQALARVYGLMNESNRAVKIYLNTVAKWRAQDRWGELSGVLKELGYLFEERKEVKKAISAFRYCLSVERISNACGLVETLLSLSRLYLKTEPEWTKEYCQEAMGLLLERLSYRFNESEEKTLAQAFYIMGLSCREKNDRKNMLMFLRQSLQIYKKYKMREKWTEIYQIYSKYIQSDDPQYNESWEFINELMKSEKLRLHKFIG